MPQTTHSFKFALSSAVIAMLLIISCSTTPQVKRDFYLGLLESNPKTRITHFENALRCSNVHTRRAAAEQLAILMSQGHNISPNTLALVRSEAHGFWAAAFDTAENMSRENALSFFFGFNLNTPSFNEARQFVLRESERRQVFFTEAEFAAIQGHHSVSGSRHNEALNFFRTFQETQFHAVGGNRSWPAQLPQLFFEYPVLINSLGRAFEFTPARNEGRSQFLQWEASLAENSGAGSSLPEAHIDDLRYRLIFFAGRMAHRGGQNAIGIPLFERALTIALELDLPDEQIDACIWYILELSFSESNVRVIERLEQHLPNWRRVTTYNGVLERLKNRLVAAQDWTNLIRTFELIQNYTDTPTAAKAWIIFRVKEEGLLSDDQRLFAASAAASNRRLIEHDALNISCPLLFARIAYNASTSFSSPAFFYRYQSSNVLRLPFFGNLIESPPREQPTELSNFLLGFFEHGAVNFVIPYIRAYESEMTPDELRSAAYALSKAELYSQGWRLINLFINREDYQVQRRDLELLFPRPYRELTETHAQKFDIAPYLLFALIRTESAFQRAVVSHAGAVGLTQLMPATAQDMAGRIRRAGGPDFFGPNNTVDKTDPHSNIYIGTFYFNHLMSRFYNNTLLTLMAYNGGQGRVRRWLNTNTLPYDLFMEGVPILETRDYGKRVTGVGAVYRALYY